MTRLMISVLGVSLVTSLIALLLSFLLNQLKGKIAAKTKYFLWLGLLVSLLLPFRPQIGSGLVQVQRQQLETPLKETALVSDNLATTTSAKTGILEQFLNLPWLQILLVIWLIGAGVTIGLQLFRFWQFHRLLKRWSQPVTDQSILDSLEGTKELLALTRPVKISYYELTTTPMLTGFREPHILLPNQNYTDEELDLIIEHELTHYKHRDIYANLLIMVVTSLYWFNPLVGFIARETKEAAESYCDYDVLLNQDKSYRTFYGETIISMISRSRQKTQKTVGLSNCFYSNKFKLKRRIEAIVNTDFSNKGLTALAVLAVASSVLFSGSVFALVDQTPLVSQTSQKTEQSSANQIKSKVSSLLNIAEEEMTNWKLTEKGDDYQISFSHDGQDYVYTLSKLTDKLTQVKVSQSQTTTSSSSTNSSSSETKTSASSVTEASSSQTSTTTEGQTTPASSAIANTSNQATTATTTTVQETSPVTTTETVTQVTTPATTTTYEAPVTTYTPAYNYDDDDYDDDWDDDWDDDDDD